MLLLSCNVAGGLKTLWPVSLEVLQQANADLLGFQELARGQMEFYLAGMPAYEAFYTLDRPPPGKGMPANGILYRRDRFTVRSAGAHWLSETPHVCGSRSWDSNCVRMLNWMVLEDALSGRTFVYCNTHLDHVSQHAREQQARMINASAAAWPADQPQILSGDMNAGASNPAIRILADAGWRDSFLDANGEPCRDRSWHGLEGDACRRAQDVPGNEKGAGRIDWIFLRGDASARRAWIVKDTDAAGNLPSDHYFVAAEIDLGRV
jgi:endonuclease/exonuclease/phosphatase family metal-dependent hydrolase